MTGFPTAAAIFALGGWWAFLAAQGVLLVLRVIGVLRWPWWVWLLPLELFALCLIPAFFALRGLARM